MHLAFAAALIMLALTYGYLNGLTISSSIVATIISARALNPRGALLVAGVGVFLGPFLLGTTVANTIGAELIKVNRSSGSNVLLAALISTICWGILTLSISIPSSYSQTLVGSLIGAAWMDGGKDAIILSGLTKTLVGLFLSPVLGLLISYLLLRILVRLSEIASPSVNWWFNRGQVLFSFLLAVSFGANDGQKIMGIIALALVSTQAVPSFQIATWVIFVSAVSIGLGALIGGRQLISTLGKKFYKIRPIEGFGAQIASVTVLFSASLLGGPVSGSQVTTMAIVGAGSADRIQKIRWYAVQRILIGWFVTIPSAALLSGVVYNLIEEVGL